jgi:hypothetical protein
MKLYDYAFPSKIDTWDVPYKDPGMTLRDYFAAKAMHALLIKEGYKTAEQIENITEGSYKIADAMVDQRTF